MRGGTINDSITIEEVSPDLDWNAVEVVVTLPTFRRPDHCLQTLRSLMAQTTPRNVAIVVMENDAEERAGIEAIAPLFRTGEAKGLVLVARERGNCAAYNAGWQTAMTRFPAMKYLLVIDDDEIAVPAWVESLVATAEEYAADLVGAPQIPVFEDGAAARYGMHPVFTPPYRSTGPVPILYSSGNVLIARRVLEAIGEPYLDTIFNFIGGGDSDFYSRCRQKGFRFAWCMQAPVMETTPARRTRFSWIASRALRNGAIASIIERRRANGGGHGRRLAKTMAIIVASPLRALMLGVRTRSAVIGLYPMQVAVGRMMAEFGLVNEQYRVPEKN